MCREMRWGCKHGKSHVVWITIRRICRIMIISVDKIIKSGTLYRIIFQRY